MQLLHSLDMSHFLGPRRHSTLLCSTCWLSVNSFTVKRHVPHSHQMQLKQILRIKFSVTEAVSTKE